MELILISGLSGSGKSVALHLLEDAGYYCVDNLPVVMLTVLVRMLTGEDIQKVAVAIDARSGHGIELLPEKLRKLSEDGIRHVFLFRHETISSAEHLRRKGPADLGGMCRLRITF